MELKIASSGEWRPAALGGSSGVHKDILEGRDCEIGWEDVYTGEYSLRARSATCGVGMYVSTNRLTWFSQAPSFARFLTSTPRSNPG